MVMIFKTQPTSSSPFSLSLKWCACKRATKEGGNEQKINQEANVQTKLLTIFSQFERILQYLGSICRSFWLCESDLVSTQPLLQPLSTRWIRIQTLAQLGGLELRRKVRVMIEVHVYHGSLRSRKYPYLRTSMPSRTASTWKTGIRSLLK